MKTTLSVSIADKIPVLDETSKHEQKRPFLLKVWGPYACFTRPEFKTNRISYDVMTPAAARGILDLGYYHQRQTFFTKQTNENETEGRE